MFKVSVFQKRCGIRLVKGFVLSRNFKLTLYTTVRARGPFRSQQRARRASRPQWLHCFLKFPVPSLGYFVLINTSLHPRGTCREAGIPCPKSNIFLRQMGKLILSQRVEGRESILRCQKTWKSQELSCLEIRAPRVALVERESHGGSCRPSVSVQLLHFFFSKCILLDME